MGIFGKAVQHEPPTALDLAGADVEQNLKMADLQNERASTSDETRHIIDPKVEASLKRKLDWHLIPLVMALCECLHSA